MKLFCPKLINNILIYNKNRYLKKIKLDSLKTKSYVKNAIAFYYYITHTHVYKRFYKFVILFQRGIFF